MRDTLKKKGSLLVVLLVLMFSPACKNNQPSPAVKTIDASSIVSLNGSISEILAGLGLENNITAVDATSDFPAAVAGKPKVGYGKSIAAERVLALKPTLVIGFRETVKPELIEQLNSANVTLLLYDQDFSVEGTKALIAAIADTLGRTEGKTAMIEKIDADLAAKVKLESQPKVLFIYARGAGNLTVCGDNTAATKMINLAGGVNAVGGFEDYKPLTSEALVKANPDVVIMFTSGLQSLGGMDGFMKIPGIAQTNAGKNQRVIEMDGQYFTGFGPRVGAAVAELSGKLGEN